jgi:multiple sugar transport system permease protein
MTALRRGPRGEAAVATRFLGFPVAFLLGMVIWPTIYVVYTSLYRYNLFLPALQTFQGLGNYVEMARDRTFWHAVRLTAVLLVMAVGLQFLFGLLLAVLVDRQRRGAAALRVLLLSPVLLSPIAMGLMWRYMFEPEIGVINAGFRGLGLQPHAWLSQPDLALWAIVAITVWQWTPFFFLVLLAGLRGVPDDVTEAAQIDGASDWRVLWHIHLPLLKPIIAIVLLIRTIETMRDFGLVYITTFGGPGIATYVLPFYAWMQGFYKWEMGYASAVAIVIVILINLLVTLFLRTFREEFRAV